MYLNYQLLLFILCEVYIVFANSQPEVIVVQGVVRGLYTETVNKRQIASFEGIPYAKPPVGKHRFKESVAADPWLGIYNATKEPPHCMQYNIFDSKPSTVSGSEDCLYLNVYTPQLPSSKNLTKLYDVIAYIHGGAYVMGKSGMHGPYLLLERDVVLVTMNYRLGSLGFLSTEDNVVPGNNGLKDQLLALKWIQQNIEAFGGNPKSVTLGGASAGGGSCSLHLLSPLSKGLFKGALCQSGTALNPWIIVENSIGKAKIIATELGCPTSDSRLMIKCLRDRPAEHIVSLQSKFEYWESNPIVPFGPVVEPVSPNAFISDWPINCLKKKTGSDVPVIFSYGEYEGANFVGNQDAIDTLLNRWDELLPHLLDYNFTVQSDKRLEVSKKIREFYKIDDPSDIHLKLARVIGDRMFIAGISKTAKISASVYNSPVYTYRFTYRGKYSGLSFMKRHVKEFEKIAGHGDDCLYTIGYLLFNTHDTEDGSKLTKQMQDIWVSFAANGTLGDNWQPVQQQLPKLVFTDIKGPGNFSLIVEDEVGEESFWDSLGFNENIESTTSFREEL